MKSPFGRARTLVYRTIARRHYIDNHGSLEDSIDAVNDDGRLRSVNPIIQQLIIAVVIEFIKWWIAQKIDEPSSVAQADEPFIADLDEDDSVIEDGVPNDAD